MTTLSAKLILVEPAGTRRELSLTKIPFTIGRQAGNDLILRDNRVSRQHAVIVTDNGSYVVEDRGSRHGTYVNGARIERHALQPNDRIEFGPQSTYALIFARGESALPQLLKRVETPAPAAAPARDLHNLNLLLEVGRGLQSGLALDEILATVVDAAVNVVAAERGFLFLRNDAGEVEFCVGRDRLQRSLDKNEAVSQSVIEEVLRHPRELCLTDSRTDPRFGGQESIVNLELRSIICLPLRRMAGLRSATTTVVNHSQETLGVLYLDSRKPVAAFSEMDRQLLQVLAGEASTAIENGRLFTAARAKERLDQQLAIARSIQQGLLPKGFKQYDFFQVTGLTLPCDEVGGDYFDLVEIPGRRYGFVVADVSGKGIPAALLTCMLQGAFSTTASLGQPPEQIAQHVNGFICQRSEVNRYATLFYGVLDPSGEFTYVNAGHLAPLLVDCKGGLRQLGAQSFPLGLFLEASYQATSVRLAPGDLLVFYTDGITEAANPAGELFGLNLLEETLAKDATDSVEELSQRILDAVTAFTAGTYQADDMTLMVMRYHGEG